MLPAFFLYAKGLAFQNVKCAKPDPASILAHGSVIGPKHVIPCRVDLETVPLIKPLW